MKEITQLMRASVKAMKPYSCARDEFQGEASIFLDANENPYNAPYNRYPDPLQRQVKEPLAVIKGVRPEQIFLGNGSDEAIDLVFRAFCEPRQDNVVAIAPSYGMYQVAAETNDVAYRVVPLDDHFDLDVEAILAAIDAQTKAIFLCSPNNPTGNSLSIDRIDRVIESFDGLVVVDEAYIDFSSHPSYLTRLDEAPNLIVLQTFSKAWGSAGIRLGMAFASEEIIAVLNKIKYPYNVNMLTQEEAIRMLDQHKQVNGWVAELLKERKVLVHALQELSIVQHIYPTDANFVLVRVDDVDAVYHHLVEAGIVVRNRNTVTKCMGCIRITVGKPFENLTLLNTLAKYKAQ